jgi:hypothetical protein
VGATTENPSFELNGALLSRCQVFVLKRLDDEALGSLLAKAEAHLERPLPLEPDAREALIALADGDGRYLLTLAETLFNIGTAKPLSVKELGQVLQKRSPAYDKDREEHYNLISALHKSIRGSDPDAALYWLARMLSGGEDPLFIARRLIRAAAEDIGEADPMSLVLANAAKDTYDFLPGGRDRAGPARRASGRRAEVERRLCRLQGGDGGGQTDGFACAAHAYPECADAPDEGPRLRQGLRLRSRRRGGLLRPELLPRRDGAEAVLPPERRGDRGQDQGSTGALGGDAQGSQQLDRCSPNV